MKTIISSRILRKLMILSVLIIGLVFVASNGGINPPVQAAHCCQTCDQRKADCLLSYSATYCNNQWLSCVGQCTWCSGGCETNAECGEEQICDMGFCRNY